MVNPQLMDYNIQNGGILIQDEGRANYCLKLKKGKLKIMQLSKITVLDEQELSKESAEKTKAILVLS